MKIIFAMTLAVSMLLFLLIISKIKDHLTNIFIALILFFFCLGSGYLVFENLFFFQYNFVSILINASPVAFGSLTFLYIFYSVYNEKPFQIRHLMLFIPFLISLVLSYLELNQNIFWANILLNLGMKIIWNIGILSYTMFFLKQSRKLIPESLVSNMKWLNQFVIIEIAVFVVYLIIFLAWLFDVPLMENVYIYSNLSAALFIFPISYIGIKNNVFTKKEVPYSGINFRVERKKIKDDGLDQYRSTKHLLNDEKVDVYFADLLLLMEEKKIYLDESLNIESLASLINLHSKYLSYIINKKTGKPFNDFINEYRIQHFISLIEDNEHERQTLLSLAYESGFASKSSFNRIFKNIKGFSPSDYIKNRS